MNGSCQDLRVGARWGQLYLGESRSDGSGGDGMTTSSEELDGVMNGPSKVIVDGASLGDLVGDDVGDSVVCMEGLTVGQV